jgi:hypothetical protein
MLRTFKSRVVRRTFWLIKVVPTWKEFEKRCCKMSVLIRQSKRCHIPNVSNLQTFTIITNNVNSTWHLLKCYFSKEKQKLFAKVKGKQCYYVTSVSLCLLVLQRGQRACFTLLCNFKLVSSSDAIRRAVLFSPFLQEQNVSCLEF